MADPPIAQLPAGFLLVDKPVGASSFDVVRRVRGALPRGTKVGHAGTLDPFATGLLVVLVGVATRLMPWVVGHDKRYLLDARLGVRSDSDDATGNVEVVDPAPAVTRAQLEAALDVERARVLQVPPQVSALHVDGERAYKAARRGEHVELAARPMRFDLVELVSWQEDTARLRLDVRCSTGTYLRALARDLGEALGVGGLAEGLRRTEVGEWRVDDALSMTGDRIDPDDVRHALRGLDQLLPDAPLAELAPAHAALLTAGGRISPMHATWLRGQAPEPVGTTASPAAPADEVPVVVASNGTVLGVAAVVTGRDGTPVLQPRVVDPLARQQLEQEVRA